jgi:hypothetical protein
MLIHSVAHNYYCRCLGICEAELTVRGRAIIHHRHARTSWRIRSSSWGEIGGRWESIRIKPTARRGETTRCRPMQLCRVSYGAPRTSSHNLLPAGNKEMNVHRWDQRVFLLRGNYLFFLSYCNSNKAIHERSTRVILLPVGAYDVQGKFWLLKSSVKMTIILRLYRK